MNTFLDELRRITLDGSNKKYRVPQKLMAFDVKCDTQMSFNTVTAERYLIEVRCGTTVILRSRAEEPTVVRNIQAAIADVVYGDIKREVQRMLPDVYTLRELGKWELSERIEARLNAILEMVTP